MWLKKGSLSLLTDLQWIFIKEEKHSKCILGGALQLWQYSSPSLSWCLVSLTLWHFQPKIKLYFNSDKNALDPFIRCFISPSDKFAALFIKPPSNLPYRLTDQCTDQLTSWVHYNIGGPEMEWNWTFVTRQNVGVSPLFGLYFYCLTWILIFGP